MPQQGHTKKKEVQNDGKEGDLQTAHGQQMAGANVLIQPPLFGGKIGGVANHQGQ